MNDAVSFARPSRAEKTSHAPNCEIAPELGLCVGAHRAGDVVHLDQGDVTVTGKQWCGPLERRDILLLFSCGLTLSAREVELNSGGRFAALAARHARELT